MSGLRVVIPHSDSKIKSGIGTKVFYDDKEIYGIQSIVIKVDAESMITATMTMPIDEIENSESLLPVLESCSLENIQMLAKKHGLKLVEE